MTRRPTAVMVQVYFCWEFGSREIGWFTGPLSWKSIWGAILIIDFGFFHVISRACYRATSYFSRLPPHYTIEREKRQSVRNLIEWDSTQQHGQIKWNCPSQTSTQHRQYWPNLFKPSNKPIDNIPMGKMVDGFHDIQQWRKLYSNQHHTMAKVKVSMSKAWWT
jgi:hypothetical protein